MKPLFALRATPVLLSALLALSAHADIPAALEKQAQTRVLDSYERLLPLEGGSNFRDLGGYKTSDGKTVRKGLLYRSGVMSGLTEKDERYLGQIGFDSVVDLRSSEELDLYPNHWAKSAGVEYLNHSYSMARMNTQMTSTSSDNKKAIANKQAQKFDASGFYSTMPYSFKPQLKMYFDQAINGQAPLVVNCSAGQDRTGIASALMLTALGVPRQNIVQDYVLSTEYRRPQVERGNVDLAAVAETNAFAQIMLRYSDKEATRAAPLITEEGIPYIVYTFQQIEKDHGTVLAYLEKELDVSADDIARLRQQYLQ